MRELARGDLTPLLVRLVTLLVVAAVAALPLAAQEDDPEEEGSAYFSISTNRTFSPQEKPSIQVWSSRVPELEFRVYRVRDPLRFFENLEDMNQFGGRAPRPSRELTWIEKFHRWKRAHRNAVRDAFRAQYRADSRSVIRAAITPARTAAPVRDRFATLPLLNSEQVVAVWRQPMSSGNMWESQVVTLEPPGKGLYLVEAVHRDLRAYTIVFVTDLAVLSKTGPGRVLAMVVDRASGVPVKDVPVRVWLDKAEVASAATDARGLVDVKVSSERPEQAIVLARHDDDFAVNQLGAWNLASDPDRSWVGYVYTDRPVYRPGHTVHFKAILRNREGNAYRLPATGDFLVKVDDSDGKTVFQRQLRPTAFGTLASSLVLPETAALGYYSVQVTAGAATMSGGFHVEEYRKPEYRVQVRLDPGRVLQGRPFEAAIEARYYYGEPVARAKVAYTVHQARYWFPQFAEYEPEGVDEDSEWVRWEQIAEEEGELDAEGKLTVPIPTQVNPQGHDMRYRVEARVTDAGNREIAGAGFGVATYGSFRVAVQPDGYVFETGQPAGLLVRAADYDGNPVETPVTVTLETWDWSARRGDPFETRQARTGPDGTVRLSFPMRRAGSLVARVTAATPEGREVEGLAYLWVTGRGEGWAGSRRGQLQIVTDKKSYEPGDTAKLLIVTGLPASHLLFTVEGLELGQARVIEAAGPSVAVEVPILPEYAPNFYVSAALIQEGQLYTAMKRVVVPPVRQQLKVEVEASKPQFTPGEKAVFRISARDWQDRPVEAEFSLGIVDEAIYAIRPEQARDIGGFFYGPNYNRVSTGSSLHYYFHGSAGKRSMQLARIRDSRHRAQLKPQFVEPKIRKAFPDTVLWLADVRTDARGEARVETEFPDSLTTWRATARGVTKDTKVGSGIEKTIVRKNVIVSLAVPRFFTSGDEVTVSAIVRNYLDTPKTARVSLEALGLELLEGAARDLEVPSQGEAKADFRFRATGASAKLLAKALTNEESDALELELPIIPYGVKLSENQSGALGGTSEQAAVVLRFPGSIEPASRSLSISVAPSLAGAIFGALDYLTAFPYGCTEQTMSSFVPNVVVSQALEELGVSSGVDRAALTRKIQAGLDRLYSFQHPDGGWGWWQTDESHLFMTAYVLAGLGQARSAGVAVRPWVLERGAQWLAPAVGLARAKPDLAAYAAYALELAGHPSPELLEQSWRRRGDLTPLGLAFLGLTLDARDDRERARALAADLAARAVSDPNDAYWKLDEDTLMEFRGDTSAEATAYALKLLARLEPESPLLPKAARWLVANRNQGYYWQSTKQTAMVIFGLTDYLRQSGELKPDFRVTVTVNGREVLARRLTGTDALSPEAPIIRLTADALEPGENRIEVRKEGAGRLYWSARTEYYSTEPRLARTGSARLNVVREYFRLTPVRDGDRIQYDLAPLEGDLHPGDVLAVRATISGDSWRYLLLEDPIPAGAEFIERDDLYDIRSRPSWWRYSYARREFHDDHAAIFDTWVPAGQTQHVYLLKIVNPGRFRVSPARLQPMYQPEYLATSEGREIVVR